jgi:alkylated DNA repair dioxygenase AlkB
MWTPAKVDRMTSTSCNLRPLVGPSDCVTVHNFLSNVCGDDFSARLESMLQDLPFTERGRPQSLHRGNEVGRLLAILVSPKQPTGADNVASGQYTGPGSLLVPVYKKYPGFQYASMQNQDRGGINRIEDYPCLVYLRQRAAMFVNVPESELSHCIATKYRAGDGIGDHQDKIDTLDATKPIVSISIGSTCKLTMTEITNGNDNAIGENQHVHGSSSGTDIPLHSGTLFVLGPQANASYTHSIDVKPCDKKRQRQEDSDVVRYSIIFRCVTTFVPLSELQRQFDDTWAHRAPSSDQENTASPTNKTKYTKKRRVTSGGSDEDGEKYDSDISTAHSTAQGRETGPRNENKDATVSSVQTGAWTTQRSKNPVDNTTTTRKKYKKRKQTTVHLPNNELEPVAASTNQASPTQLCTGLVFPRLHTDTAPCCNKETNNATLNFTSQSVEQEDSMLHQHVLDEEADVEDDME